MGMRGSVNMPPVVKNLLIVNVIVFLAQTILPLPLRERRDPPRTVTPGGRGPMSEARGRFHQLITSVSRPPASVTWWEDGGP